MKTFITRLIVLVAVFSFVCSDALAGQNIPSTLRVITSNGILATSDIVIGKNEVVIWNNRIFRQPVQIIISGYEYPISPHPLTKNFVKYEDILATKIIIVPGMTASYFFDHDGKFTYSILGDKINFKGTVTVGK